MGKDPHEGLCGTSALKTGKGRPQAGHVFNFLNEEQGEEAPFGADFVCLDQNLRESALKEGFIVLP